jgi:hypothetical protein
VGRCSLLVSSIRAAGANWIFSWAWSENFWALIQFGAF